MELEFVSQLRQSLPKHPRLRIGVGDDAALIDATSNELVVTTDLLIDGVHFLTDEHSPEQIGYKALAVNLSDLAAMAARPLAAVVSLALPRGDQDQVRYACQLLQGMLPLAERYDCPIAGGDTNVGPGPLVISVTAFGAPTEHGVWRRDGAKSGDWLLVTGSLGGSLAGKHLDFQPRVEEALYLNQQYTIHAAMDTTDGLAIDLRRLAEASSVGALIDGSETPIAKEADSLAQTSGLTPLDHALGDGEDFELLLAAPEQEARNMLNDQPLECGLTCIGKIMADKTLQLRQPDGQIIALPALGYEHH